MIAGQGRVIDAQALGNTGPRAFQKNVGGAREPMDQGQTLRAFHVHDQAAFTHVGGQTDARIAGLVNADTTPPVTGRGFDFDHLGAIHGEQRRRRRRRQTLATIDHPQPGVG